MRRVRAIWRRQAGRRVPPLRSLAGLAVVGAILAWSALSVVNAFGTVEGKRSSSSAAAYPYEEQPTVATAIKNAQDQTVTQAPTGSSVHDTATVSGSQGTPTGTVTFRLFGSTTNCTGSFSDEMKTLVNGAASSTPTTVPSTGLSYIVLYDGSMDSNYTDASSACEPLSALPALPSTVSSGSFARYGTSDSQAVTVANVPSRILVFFFSGKLGGDTLSSVTYAGQPMQLLAQRNQNSVHIEMRYLINPPAGTAQLAWTKTGTSQNIVWGFGVYRDVNQATPWGTFSTAGATGDTAGSKSVVVNAQSGDLVVDGVVFNGPNVVGSGPSAGAGQSQRSSRSLSTTEGGSSDKLAASPVTMSWTPAAGAGNGLDWALIGAPLRPVSGGGGPLSSSTTTQSSTTASDVAPGSAVTDVATVTGAGPVPTGIVTFFLCDPATVAANGGNCQTGGMPVGGPKPLDPSGHVTSDPSTSTLAIGTYCWRAVYSGDGTYNPSSDGGPANECFTTAVPPGGGTVVFHLANSYARYGTSDSQSVTVPNVANRILIFQFAGKLGGDTLSSVTYGGQPLQLLAVRNQNSVHVEIRYLVNPPTGPAQLAWTKTGTSQNITWGWSIYSGVNQVAPFGAAVQNGATADTPGSKSVVVAAATGDLVVDAFVVNGPNVVASGPTAGAGQTARWSRSISTSEGGSSDKAGAASVTMSWTPAAGSGTGLDWALLAAPLKAA